MSVMTYSVEILDYNGETVEVVYSGKSESKARKVASNEAETHYMGNRVYVTFFRPSDGQKGWLNRNGHEIVGRAW